ncbi:MAG: DUF3618 domain-containing protein [Jannaschia sp.]
MTDSNHASPRELERDVEHARADLEGSLGQLRDKMSPGAMLEDALAYFKGDGESYADALMREARANPIPVMLVGVGLAWLALGASRPKPRRVRYVPRSSERLNATTGLPEQEATFTSAGSRGDVAMDDPMTAPMASGSDTDVATRPTGGATRT